ncbi:MipA/OmpV family protein [Acinetobacter sp. ANC 3832]|uniref:MipA/OmpV family protein n=1 Tax=Acinetobacter sp. ANC 3832 TaxID=1977874 RepID=UPI001D175DB0|nr:MipA/OmpV family protein [Acinetobacter sp. ANC 3832]
MPSINSNITDKSIYLPDYTLMKIASLSLLIGSLCVSSVVFADDEIHPTLTIGADYSVDFQPYKGGKSYQQSILPTIFFDNKKIYAEGDEAGVYLLNDEKNQLRLNAYYDGTYYSPSGELSQLDQRKWSVMAGASYMRTTPYGALKAQIGTDVLARSKGTVATVSYLAEIKKDAWSFYPEMGLQWNDANYNQYYYGVSSAESTRTGIQAYQPSQSIHPYANLTANYQISKHWNAFAEMEFNYLSKQQSNSPMIEKHTDFSPSIGFDYKF